MVASSTAVILSLAHASEVFPGSMAGEKQYFGLNQFLGGTSTVVILSVACSESPSVISSYNCSIPSISSYNCSIPRFNDWEAVFSRSSMGGAVFPGPMIGKQYFGGAIAGLEAELNGSDPICGALCLSSQPTCYYISSPGPERGLSAHRGRGARGARGGRGGLINSLGPEGGRGG